MAHQPTLIQPHMTLLEIVLPGSIALRLSLHPPIGLLVPQTTAERECSDSRREKRSGKIRIKEDQGALPTNDNTSFVGLLLLATSPDNPGAPISAPGEGVDDWIA